MPARKHNPAKIARQEARLGEDQARKAVVDLDRAQFVECDGKFAGLTPAMQAEYDAACAQLDAAVRLSSDLHTAGR